MEPLNEYVPLESLMKTLCKHNKMHLEEIEKLQERNSELEKELKELKDKLNEFSEIEHLVTESAPDTPLEKVLRQKIKETKYVQSLLCTIKGMEKKYAKLQSKYYELRRLHYKSTTEANREALKKTIEEQLSAARKKEKNIFRLPFNVFKKRNKNA